MNLLVNTNTILLQQKLENERNSILNRRLQLLEQFRTYVLNKLIKMGKPLEVRYSLINGNEELKYKDLEIGESFLLELVSFKFDLQTELLSDYEKYEYQVTKKTEQMEELEDDAAKKTFSVRRLQQPLSKISEFDQQKIIERIQNKVDSLLTAIFKGKLVFSDSEYQRLVNLNSALELELQSLNEKMAALNLDDNSFSVQPEKARVI